MKELKLIPPTDPRVQTAIAPYTDEMLKEMIAVVGLANKNNKLVDSYQVEVDEIYK